MDVRNLLNIIGDLVLRVYAFGSLVRPVFVGKVLSITLQAKRGIAEFRILSGGSLLGLSVAVLLINQPLGYHLLGVAWIGAGTTRVLSYFVDRPPLNATYIVSFIGEITLGIMMLV